MKLMILIIRDEGKRKGGERRTMCYLSRHTHGSLPTIVLTKTLCK